LLAAWSIRKRQRPAIACGPVSVLKSQGLLSVTNVAGNALIAGAVSGGVERIVAATDDRQTSIAVRENVYAAIIHRATSLSFTRNGKRESLGRIRPARRAHHCTRTGADVFCTRTP
jgi:hypothetical protein